MVVEHEAPCGGELGQGGIETVFEFGRQGDVADGAALGADQMVVVLRQRLGELEMGVVITGHDAADHPGGLEDGQVAVHRALGQVGAAVQHVDDADRLPGLAQHLDQFPAGAGETMPRRLEAVGHLGVEIGGHRRPGYRTGADRAWSGRLSQVNRWLNRTDVPRGADYDARWTALAASGANIHGEADLLMALLHDGVDGAPRVLDAGCGTGRVAIELARRGVDVVGVDVDPAMLAEARAKAPEGHWVQGDLATLDLAGTDGPSSFDLVAMPGNVMIFVAPGTEGAVLARLAAHLVPGGLLVGGFQLGPDRLALERYDALAAEAGLHLVDRFATWDRARFVAGGDYAVSVHRLAAVSGSPG